MCVLFHSVPASRPMRSSVCIVHVSCFFVSLCTGDTRPAACLAWKCVPLKKSPVGLLVEGLQERSRIKMMDELRRFTTVNDHQLVKTGTLEKTLASLSVVEPQFTVDFPAAVVREGADEVTLRREEGMLRTFINTTNVG